ncbi:MAG: MerC domain-containing protein [Pseudomonadota bacterium]
MERDSSPNLDRLAIGLSAMCVVHCVLSVVLVALLSSATFLTDPVIHRAGLAGAVLLAAVALRQGYVSHRARRPAIVGLAGLSLMTFALFVPHGWAEVAATVTGVSILAAAHLMNARSRA